MAEAKEPPRDSATSKADARALLEEAEAEAAEAEALAAAARARARAARLRREALAEAEKEAQKEAEAKAAEEARDAEEAVAPDEEVTEGAEAKTDEDVAETHNDAETDEDVAETADATDVDEAETEKEDVSDETPEDEESEPKPTRFRRRLRMPPLSVTWKAAVILLICAFVAASGYMMWNRHEVTERNQRAARFVAGAKQGVVNLTSMDFNKAKEDVQRVIDSSTGQFHDDFQARAKDFTTVVEQSKVVTQGTVNAAAVQTINGDFALVLVAATSHITNAAGAKDEPRNWRLKVTVKDDGGQYKMSNVEFIP
jgi:Mce-associated membrane protein